MRYNVKIRYNNIETIIKITNKPENEKYTLPEFLKLTREKYNHSIIDVHQLTDYPVQECEEMENGIKPITKDFLEEFTEKYKLPKKLVKLGIDNSKSTLANRICDLRISANQTQKEISTYLKIAQTTYAGYETGKSEPDVKTLIKLANFYNVSLDFLMGRY